jgi:tetratricopeptide (TPR) repeat protein
MAEQVKLQLQAAGHAYRQRDFKSAVRRCDALLRELGPRSDLLNLRGMSLLELGLLEAAAADLDKALEIEPARAEMHMNAALIQEQMCNPGRARRHALEAARLATGNPGLLLQAARVCHNSDAREQALRLIERSLQLDAGVAEAWHLKGTIHLDLDDREQARSALEQAVIRRPDYARALATLAPLAEEPVMAANVKALLQRVVNSGMPNSERSSAAFALADIERRAGRHDEAFEAFRKANELAASGHFQGPKALQDQIALRLGEAADWRPRPDRSRPTGVQPLFIVGMPRSGTSLTEQVLSAHDRILAVGELQAMRYVEERLRRKGVRGLSAIQGLNSRQRGEAAARYLAALPPGHKDFDWVSDKAPMNFERLGMIDELFPGARIMHCTRHPLDTILSCYFQDFQRGISWSFDLEATARMYVAQVRLMERWREVMPGRILEVNYELMVADLPAMARRMADFLDLEFQPAMEAPHEVRRVVGTASNQQVRLPVYQTSVGRWKKYRDYLQPVIDYLESAGIAVPINGSATP